MAKVGIFDGNFMIHRAFSNAGKHREISTIDKSTVTSCLSSICSLSLAHHCSHILVTFDGPQGFRKEIYKKYKLNRARGDSTIIVDGKGNEHTVPWTVGKLVKPMKEVLGMAGITYSHKKMYEADDLMGSGCKSFTEAGHRVVVFTRDKDIASQVSELVDLYWPIEKRLMKVKDIYEYFGVYPKQIRDYLTLLGDKVDNIPGIPGWGPDKACRFLAKYGSIKKALDDPEGRAILRPHFGIIRLGKKLTTLRRDQHYDIEDCVIQPFDSELQDYVWKIPDSLKLLGDTRKAAGIKGLFGRR